MDITELYGKQCGKLHLKGGKICTQWDAVPCSSPEPPSHLPIIIHDGDKEADLIHVLGGNVKDYCFIVGGIKCVFLYGGFLLFQPSPVTEQRHFDIGI